VKIRPSPAAVAAVLALASPTGFAAGLCQGQVPTHVGSAVAETMSGTPSADVFLMMGGSDTIKAGGGNDTVCAGPGSDRVLGGVGDDNVKGGPGDDTLSGDVGSDRLVGGPGTDTTRGARGARFGTDRDYCSGEIMIFCHIYHDETGQSPDHTNPEPKP
jgi:Ca2+-binding RTX toxin-like protein